MAITKTFNKIALGFMPNYFLNLFTVENAINLTIVQINTRDAILFAEINFKHYYN